MSDVTKTDAPAFDEHSLRCSFSLHSAFHVEASSSELSFYKKTRRKMIVFSILVETSTRMTRKYRCSSSNKNFIFSEPKESNSL